MPYISRTKRAMLEPTLAPLRDQITEWRDDDGTLNYVLTSLVQAWLPARPRYANYARAIAALECAKLELYRQSVGPYEDDALVQNGPI